MSAIKTATAKLTDLGRLCGVPVIATHSDHTPRTRHPGDLLLQQPFVRYCDRQGLLHVDHHYARDDAPGEYVSAFTLPVPTGRPVKVYVRWSHDTSFEVLVGVGAPEDLSARCEFLRKLMNRTR